MVVVVEAFNVYTQKTEANLFYRVSSGTATVSQKTKTKPLSPKQTKTHKLKIERKIANSEQMSSPANMLLAILQLSLSLLYV